MNEIDRSGAADKPGPTGSLRTSPADKVKEYNKGIAALLTPAIVGLLAHYGLQLDFNTTLALVSMATGAVVVWVRNRVNPDPAHFEVAKKVLVAFAEEIKRTEKGE